MKQGAFFLAIGDELLDGRVQDKNIHYAGQVLGSLGMELQGAQVFPDDVNKLVEVMQQATKTHSLLWVSGGLGPTDDDKTLDVLSRAFDAPLEENNEVKSHIAAMSQATGLPNLDRHNRQARVPKGAVHWLNGAGTAPGILLNYEGTDVVCMPGVPKELQWLTQNHLVPYLKSNHVQTTVHSEAVRCFGLPEAGLAQLLEPLASEFPNIKIQYRPTFPETIVRLTSQEVDDAELQAAVGKAQRLLGKTCYGVGTASLEERIIQKLRARGEHLLVAESCTGGLLAQRLSAIPGASKCFWGGVVTYDNTAKTKLLKVQDATLQREGAVSEAVAREMVEGALSLHDGGWALSVTGIAGPDGGTPDKPVGTVCFGMGKGAFVKTKRRELGQWSRAQIQLLSVHVALHWLRREIDA